MQLPNSLIKAFAKTITANSSSKTSKNSSVRGTAVISEGKKYVRLDSSDILTPISEATDIQNGDRVLVSIENHVATVIGNYTCPASARTASKFMKLTNNGLLVGDLDEEGNSKGTASLVAPGAYHVVDSNGNHLATFAPGEIDLGDLNAIISFCGGKCSILSRDDVMLLKAEKAPLGLRSASTKNDKTYRAEVVCQAKDEDPVVSIQAYEVGDDNPSHVSVGKDGIALVGDVVSYNGSEVLRSNKLISSGAIKATANFKANSAKTVSCTANIPEGFHLAGVREVQANNSKINLHGFYTHPSTNTVAASFNNTSNVDVNNVTITIEWFALYAKGEQYVGDDIITLEDDDTEGGS